MLLNYILVLTAQDSLMLKKKMLVNIGNLIVLDSMKKNASFKMPQYKQGFFCNFEDQLNRKKVPLNFNLGNSKY